MIKRYSKQWFYQFFKKIKDKGDLGMGELGNHCALWHLGVRLKGSGYWFPNKNVEIKFNSLCKVLGEPSIDQYDEPNWEAVYRVNDNKDIVAVLKEQNG